MMHKLKCMQQQYKSHKNNFEQKKPDTKSTVFIVLSILKQKNQEKLAMCSMKRQRLLLQDNEQEGNLWGLLGANDALALNLDDDFTDTFSL